MKTQNTVDISEAVSQIRQNEPHVTGDIHGDISRKSAIALAFILLDMAGGNAFQDLINVATHKSWERGFKQGWAALPEASQ